MKNINYGFKVKIKFSKESPYKTKTIILRNVTEIHYIYPSIIGKKVAFESNIHSTGLTYYIYNIKEFEATLETKKAKEFLK